MLYKEIEVYKKVLFFLKVIRKGIVYEYDGPKSESKEIAKFMKKEARSDWNPDALEIEDSVYVIKSEKMFDNFLKEHELSCVFFYAVSIFILTRTVFLAIPTLVCTWIV